MKKRKSISFVLAAVMLLTLTAGCGKKGQVTESTDSEGTSLSAESSGSSAVSNGSSAETSTIGSNSVSNSNNGEVTGNNTATVAQSEDTKQTVASTGIRWGVTNTKKMPDFILNITNTTLKVVTSSSNNDDVANLLAFKALTGLDVTIDYDVVVWSTLPERVAAMVLSGESPDYFEYAGSQWPNLVKQPYWDDWTNYIDFDDALWSETASVNNGLGDYQGKRVGLFIPTKKNCFGASLIYNTKLVQEAIDGNSALYDPLDMYYNNDWTWDTLYSFVEEISDPDNHVYGIDLPNYAVQRFISSTGEDIIKINSDKKLTYNLESQNVIRALNFARKIYQISNVAATWEGPSMLLNNTCGFWDNSNGIAGLYSSDSMVEAVKAGKIKAVPFPRDPQSNTYYVGGRGSSYVLPSGAPNPWLTAAWMYYLRYITYNTNADLNAANEKKFMQDYGWSEDLYALIAGDGYSSKYSKLTYTISQDCIPYGESLSDFDQAKYWSMIIDPSVLTSTVVETIGPGLQEVINRYNAS